MQLSLMWIVSFMTLLFVIRISNGGKTRHVLVKIQEPDAKEGKLLTLLRILNSRSKNDYNYFLP